MFDSQAQAAGAMKIHPAALKRMKGIGCPAFLPGGRVDEHALLAWMSDNPDALKAKEGAPLADQKLGEEIRKHRIKNDRDEGKLVPRSYVIESIGKMLAEIDRLLEQKLCNEYPSAVAGLDVPQARIFGKRLGDQIRDAIGQAGSCWA